MRAVLAADFPDHFVQECILPELRKRVEVVLVGRTRAVAASDLGAFAPDVVLHMVEYGSHSESALLSAACRKAGITVRALSRKKASWTFLPPPREVVEVLVEKPKHKPKVEVVIMEQPKPQTNGTAMRVTIGDLPGAKVIREAVDAKKEPAREIVVHEVSQNALDVVSAFTSALGKQSEALLEHARGMRDLAKAISGMPAAVTHGGAPEEVLPKKSAASLLEAKIVETLSRFPPMTAAEVHVIVGMGDDGIKATKNAVQLAVATLARLEKVARTGTGGIGDPYRYSTKA